MTGNERAGEARIAYHEAGHAITAAACGFRPDNVTIVRDGCSEGHTTFVSFDNGPGSAFLDILVAAAGSAGEHIYTLEQLTVEYSSRPIGTRRDLRRAHDLLMGLSLPSLAYRAFVVAAHEFWCNQTDCRRSTRSREFSSTRRPLEATVWRASLLALRQ